jgi:hypothetical protein
MSQIGRIGGQVLTDNLLRAGVDLAFETNLLYLKVSPVTAGVSLNEDSDPNYGKSGSTSLPASGIGIKTDVPLYDLDVTSNIRTTDLSIDSQLSIANIKINNPNTFTTLVGGIDVYINGGGEIWHDRLTTASLVLDGNLISSISNSNITLDPNGSGSVELLANTTITGDLSVIGNIGVNGNLTGISQITLGDQTIDTVSFNTDFTQSIIPGADLTYALGADAGDSSPRRWAEVHSPTWTNITVGTYPGSGLIPQSVTVSNQMTLDGIVNKISAIQSNEDILLTPATGITYIEGTKWENNYLTNLRNTPLTFASTDTGYLKFNNTDAIVIPAGPESDRRVSPEVGETRWNTDQQYLECFDGTVWAVSIGGGGGTITSTDMEDLSNIYALVLG